MAARSPPGVSRPARSRTLPSAARAPASSSSAVARAMISALYREIIPSSSAAAVLSQRVRDLIGGELAVLRGGVPAGQLRGHGELAGGRVGLDPVPGGQHA